MSDETTCVPTLYSMHRKLRRKEITHQEWWDCQKDYPIEEVEAIIKFALAAEDRLRKYKNSYGFRMKIRKYCNFHGYTDIEPYEVVKVVSAKCVEIRAMDATPIELPKQFFPGGFSGHYADNRNQKYEYKSNENNSIHRIRLGKKGWDRGQHVMSDRPHKFYDYNF